MARKLHIRLRSWVVVLRHDVYSVPHLNCPLNTCLPRESEFVELFAAAPSRANQTHGNGQCGVACQGLNSKGVCHGPARHPRPGHKMRSVEIHGSHIMNCDQSVYQDPSQDPHQKSWTVVGVELASLSSSDSHHLHMAINARALMARGFLGIDDELQ